MATLSTSALTLADWAKRLDPNGNLPEIAEMLSQTNAVLDDCLFKEGNLPTGHRVSIRTGLPASYWRAYNQGVPSSKSTTAQVDEACGMLETYSVVDVDLANLNGNTAAFRLSEDQAFIEGMNQAQTTALFYGNPGTDPKQYLGFAPRYSSLSAGNSQNVLSAGGASTDNTSVWLVVWGENTVFCTFPKGSKAGLQSTDHGEVNNYDANSNRYRAYQTHYKWDNGLVVKDWRYVVRIANIKVSDLLAQTGTQAATASTHLIKLMTRALYRIPNIAMGRAAFYMNRTAHSGMALAALDKSQYVLKINEAVTQFGAPANATWLSFLGVPLRCVDQILNTEAVVS